ncbi:MAG: hypothetical protein ACRDTT_24500 [Pseudonocardiaceae bacterium]
MRNPELVSCADRLCGHGNPTGDRCTLPPGPGFSVATRAGRVVIDLDPLWRLVVLLAGFGMIPLLLALGWVACRARDSCTAVRRMRPPLSAARHGSTPGSGR